MNPTTITTGKAYFEYEYLHLGAISRDEVTIAVYAEALQVGTVMGKVTATQEYAPYNPTATDGTEVAIAVLGRGVDTTVTSQKSVVTARLAEVNKRSLVFVGTVTETQKQVAYNSLKENLIIVRD